MKNIRVQVSRSSSSNSSTEPDNHEEIGSPLRIMDKPPVDDNGEENAMLANMMTRVVRTKKKKLAEVRECGEGGSSTAIVLSVQPTKLGKKRGGEVVIEKKAKRPKGCKTGRKVRITDQRKVFDGLRTRSSPKKLIELLEALNEDQKRAIQEIGFGRIL